MKRAYTVVELLVTVAIVLIVAASLGMFVVKMLTLHEQEREDAYVRETLSDILANYADLVSVGSFFSVKTNVTGQSTIVRYRQETGGMSLETGRVTRVAYLTTATNSAAQALDLNIYTMDRDSDSSIFGSLKSGLRLKFARNVRGDAALIPLGGELVSCTITPFSSPIDEPDVLTLVEDKDFNGFRKTEAALGYLEIAARYEVRNDDGEMEKKTVTAGRLVRLWNHCQESER